MDDDVEDLEKTRQYVNALQQLIDIAARLGPPGFQETALLHNDFACSRNVLFSEDRTRVEALVDWDDAVVVPRDLAAIYPMELMESSAWECDPDDVHEIPPGTLWEDTGIWEEKIMETRQRTRFREVVTRLDPRLGALYTDRRARFRRRVHYIVTLPWRYWDQREDWILRHGLQEAMALVGQETTVGAQ